MPHRFSDLEASGGNVPVTTPRGVPDSERQRLENLGHDLSDASREQRNRTKNRPRAPVDRSSDSSEESSDSDFIRPLRTSSARRVRRSKSRHKDRKHQGVRLQPQRDRSKGTESDRNHRNNSTAGRSKRVRRRDSSSEEDNTIAASGKGMSRRINLRLEDFNGRGQSFTDWREQFERVCKLEGVAKADRKRFLATMLTGPAKFTLDKISHRSRMSYRELMEILEEKFEPVGQEKLYRAKVRQCRMRKDESFSDFAYRFEKRCRLAYPDYTYENNAEVIDSFVDRLYGNSPGELFYEVSNRLPKGGLSTFTEAIELAREVATIVEARQNRNKELQQVPDDFEDDFAETKPAQRGKKFFRPFTRRAQAYAVDHDESVTSEDEEERKFKPRVTLQATQVKADPPQVSGVQDSTISAQIQEQFQKQQEQLQKQEQSFMKQLAEVTGRLDEVIKAQNSTSGFNRGRFRGRGGYRGQHGGQRGIWNGNNPPRGEGQNFQVKSPYQGNNSNGRGGAGFSNYNPPRTADGGVVTCNDCNMKGHHAGSSKCPKQQSRRGSGGYGASEISVGITKAPVKVDAGPQVYGFFAR